MGHLNDKLEKVYKIIKDEAEEMEQYEREEEYRGGENWDPQEQYDHLKSKFYKIQEALYDLRAYVRSNDKFDQE